MVTSLTSGVTMAGVIAIVVYLCAREMTVVSDRVLLVLCGVVTFSILVFVFSLYAACSGQTCSQIVLGVVFVVFVGGLAVLGTLAFLSAKRIDTWGSWMWTDGPKEGWQDLEKWLNCSCWSDAPNICAPDEQRRAGVQTCDGPFRSKYRKIVRVLGGCFAGLALISLVGAVVAFVGCGRGKKADGEELGTVGSRRGFTAIYDGG